MKAFILSMALLSLVACNNDDDDGGKDGGGKDDATGVGTTYSDVSYHTTYDYGCKAILNGNQNQLIVNFYDDCAEWSQEIFKCDGEALPECINVNNLSDKLVVTSDRSFVIFRSNIKYIFFKN